MEIIKLNTVGFIQNIKEHKEFKSYMLNYINERTSDTIEKYDDITLTDWKYATSVNRQYIPTLGKILKPYLKNVAQKLKTTTVEISNMWFQHYSKNSKHDWHFHTETNWSAIYYIDLPEEKLKTQLFDLYENKILDNLNLKEGYLFVFPANIFHKSPINTTNKTKTIISFNINFHDVKFEE
jgi:hypothetical protein